MRIIPLLAVTLFFFLLAGCAGTAGRLESAYYDLPEDVSTNPLVDKPLALNIRQIEVQAPVWLNSPSMQYRLLYAEAERRMSFAESRWVAPPAGMLELTLKRHNTSGTSNLAVDGCRLRVDLDEFIQVFDSPASSRALVEVRATLLSSRNGKFVAQRRFTQAPSAGSDARSGVAAFVVAVRNLSTDMNQWFTGMALESPVIIEHCRATGFN